MSNTTTSQTENQQQAQAPQSGSGAYAQIAALARRAPSRERYYAESLSRMAEALGSPYAAIEVRLASQVVTDHYHKGPTDPKFWASAAQGLITESLVEKRSVLKLFASKDGKVRVAAISATISDVNSAILGAVAMIVPCDGEDEAKHHQDALTSLAAVVSTCADFVGQGASEGVGAGNVLAKAAAYSSRQELAFALTNNLLNKTGCDQVTLGMVRGRHVSVIAISGFDEVKKRSPGVAVIQSAMEECLDGGEMIVSQQAGQWSRDDHADNYRLHQQWHASVGNAAVVSIPLFLDEQCSAVVSMRRKPGEAFAADQLEQIEQFLQPYAVALNLVDRATRPAAAHVLASLSQTVRAVITPGRWLTKVALVAGMSLAGWFALGTMQYAVTVPCVVSPAGLRHFSAPYEAKLDAGHVVAGDRVRAGDVLAEFDTGELELERVRLSAEIAIAKLEHAQAMAEGESVKAKLALAKSRKLQASLEITDSRIAGSVIRAPFDAVVTRGDLRKRSGEVLTQGEALYELSSEQGWTLRLIVPESEIQRVKSGLSGRYAGNATPEQMTDFRILRIEPSATQHAGKNVFVAEARMESPPAWIRSGMEGVAEIRTGRRPVWWVVTHRVVDFLRLKLWL